MWKRTNALRRLYQRIKNNNELRESGKNQYTKAKIEYQAAITKEKINSWKQHCTATSLSNQWNEVYKLASGKARNKETITTLQKPEGSTTANMTETLNIMMEQMIPEDNPQDDTEHHKEIRRQTE